MLRISGEILSKNRTVAVVSDGMIVESDNTRLPLYLKRTGDVEGWLADRAIDSHRTNSRLLKKALRLGTLEDAEVVLKVNAATITDTYWFRETGSPLVWEDIRFKKNLFDGLALRGDPDSFNQPYSPTPELTNTGSFEKCWRFENGGWWMYKAGNEWELFSELFICRFGQALSFPMAEYTLDGPYIKTKDFTGNASVNFESADSLVGENEDYGFNFQKFWSLSPKLAEQYLGIIYLDTLCFNMDRHTKNYGILRDVESGEILSMAPNFDNNIALFARGIPKLDRKNDRLVDLFLELLTQDARAKELANSFPVPSREMIKRCVMDILMPADPENVCAFIMEGNDRIQSALIQNMGMEPTL